MPKFFEVAFYLGCEQQTTLIASPDAERAPDLVKCLVRDLGIKAKVSEVIVIDEVSCERYFNLAAAGLKLRRVKG